MNLSQKIFRSQQIIRQADKRYSRESTVVAWTGGKDSTVLLHLIRNLYQTKVPFPVLFNDSTMEFLEIYAFIKNLSRKWNLELIVVPHLTSDLKKFDSIKDKTQLNRLARLMKINAINHFLATRPVKAFMVGIRWDEHPARSQESYFSPRKGHYRVHPILHFTETDIWEYINKYRVPYVKLYDQGYRSLGEKPFTQKAEFGGNERSGREPEKEKLMEQLRQMGYW